MTTPQITNSKLPNPRRRRMVEIVALSVLLVMAGIVVWEIFETANASLPDLPTKQPEPTLAPVLALLELTPPTSTPEPTSTVQPTPVAVPTIPCDVAPRELCGQMHTALPTPTPPLQCDDSRLIGGQFCVWPTLTPQIEQPW